MRGQRRKNSDDTAGLPPLLWKMATQSLWQRFQQYYLRYDALGFSLDISRMRFPDDFLEKMQPQVAKAFATMEDLEAGGIANPDENRMVGHYWLRNPHSRLNDEVRAEIEQTNARIQNSPPMSTSAGSRLPTSGNPSNAFC